MLLDERHSISLPSLDLYPSDHVKNSTGNNDCGPCIALMRAVLARAIQDYTGLHLQPGKGRKYTDVTSQDRKSAWRWIFDERDPERPFSFDWVCNHLELCAVRLRKKLKSLHELTEQAGPVHRSTTYRVDLTQILMARRVPPVTMEMTV